MRERVFGCKVPVRPCSGKRPRRGPTRGTVLVVFAACLAAAFAAGCDGNDQYMTEDRLDKGLVVVLPGIEGVSGLNKDIRQGLIDAGVDRAIPIWSWGRPVPLLGVLVNQVDFLGNRLAGAGIANRIREYQKKYPNRPVHVIGHSGGGGVAVFVAEGLDEDHKVDGIILLSASVSSAYDLTKALRHCRGGVVNYYSRDDSALLGVGTIVMGTVDGTHGPAAGLIGFDRPKDNAKEDRQVAYARLYQMDVGSYMFCKDIGSHAGTAQVGFVTHFVAPWVLSDFWPIEDVDAYTHKDAKNVHDYVLPGEAHPDKTVPTGPGLAGKRPANGDRPGT